MKNGTLSSVLGGAVLLFIVSSGNATTVVVSHSTPCVAGNSTATTIQAGINAAPSGGTVIVCPGTYGEQVVINKPLTLKGATDSSGSLGAAVIAAATNMTAADGYYTAQIRVTGGSVVTISDLTVDGTGVIVAGTGCPAPDRPVGIQFSNTGTATATVNRVVIRNQNVAYTNNGFAGFCNTGVGVLAQDTTNVTVRNSSIHGFDGWGILIGPGSVVNNSVLGMGALISDACISANAGEIFDNVLGSCGSGIIFGGAVRISQNTVASVSAGIHSHIGGSTTTGAYISENRIVGAENGIIDLNDYHNTGGNTIEDNRISNIQSQNSVGAGILIRTDPPDTISRNFISDSRIGISGVTGTNVSDNTFHNVTIRTQ